MDRIISYFTFLILSKNHHSIHSPFVFNFVTKALYENSIPSDKWNTYLYLKKEVTTDRSFIDVNDFGAGSKAMNSNVRKIKQIARKAGIKNKRAKILFRCLTYLKPNNILELGTSLGLSSAVMSLSRPEAELITIEGCKNTLSKANYLFEKYHLNNITSIEGTFDQILPSVIKNKKFDFLFIDGNHSKDTTIHYFNILLNTIHNDSCIIFDDIHWSKGMEEAWNYIKDHSAVTVSIDTYQWGIIFFRKEQQKEHFIIRV